MANYAYIENDNIIGVHDSLPENWRNISNFFALENDPEYLKSLGWHKIEKVIPEYDPEYQKLDDMFHWIDNGVVYESRHVIDYRTPYVAPSEAELEEQRLSHLNQQWANIRKVRDQLMADFQWRYSRYEREIRLNVPTTDTLANMDAYMQALADVPTNQNDPYNIVWPTYNVEE